MFFSPEIYTVKTNEELQIICEEQWNEIEYLKQENEEFKKDIAELSKQLYELKILFNNEKTMRSYNNASKKQCK